MAPGGRACVAVLNPATEDDIAIVHHHGALTTMSRASAVNTSDCRR
jgi:hypothetical protein